MAQSAEAAVVEVVEVTGNTLNNALAELLTGAVSSLGQAKDFLAAELPDVAYQALLYYGVYNFILFIFSIGGLYTLSVFWKNVFTEKEDNLLIIKDKASDDNEAPWVISVCASIALLIASMVSVNFVWLKTILKL